MNFLRFLTFLFLFFLMGIIRRLTNNYGRFIIRIGSIYNAPTINNRYLCFSKGNFSIYFRSIRCTPIAISPTMSKLFRISCGRTIYSLKRSFRRRRARVIPLRAQDILGFVSRCITCNYSCLFRCGQKVSFFCRIVGRHINVQRRRTIIFVIRFTCLFICVNRRASVICITRKRLTKVNRRVIPTSMFFQFVRREGRFFFYRA